MAVAQGYSKVITSGLVFAYDTGDVLNSYLGEPTTNILPSPNPNSYPTTGNGWGTYNTNQYCGNNGCGAFWSIPSISSVSSNIVTTSAAHGMRTFDVLRPQSSGGGLTANTDYLVRAWNSTQFSLYNYNSSQDGSQGYINPSTGWYKVQDDYANDNRIAVNSSSFPTMWWGAPHLPNSGLIKEVRSKGFDFYPTKTDCLRLHWYRPDGVTDGMAYGVTPNVTSGTTYTLSFWMKAVDSNAAGNGLYVQYYNTGNATAAGFSPVLGAVGQWQKYQLTSTASATGVYLFYFFPNSGPMTVDIADIQFEANSHATAFTLSSRSSTQGLIDVTAEGSINMSNAGFDSNSQMYFDGTSKYLNIPSYSDINPSTGYISVEAIFNASSTGTQNGSIIYNKESEYELSAGGGYISYAFRPNWAWVGSTAFNTNQWYHTMLTYDQVYQRLYINGTLVYNAALSGAIGNVYSNDLRIGARGGNGAASGFFNGYIPVVKIYNRGLSAAEVLQNYNHYKNRFNF